MLFAHFTSKLNVCTFVGVMFAHLWLMFFLNTDLHICGRNVCTNVVVCTFVGEMFAQMWLFAHLWAKMFAQMWAFVHLWVFAHFTAPHGPTGPYTANRIPPLDMLEVCGSYSLPYMYS